MSLKLLTGFYGCQQYNSAQESIQVKEEESIKHRDSSVASSSESLRLLVAEG